MRNRIQILTAIALSMGLIMSAACSKSGGGGGPAAATPGAPAATATSCTTQYVGSRGNWYSNGVTVTNPTIYMNFLNANRLCGGYGCPQVTTGQFFQLQITMNSYGYLPGRVAFRITPTLNTWGTTPLSGDADGYVNASNNGMVLNYNGYYATPGYPGYPGYPGQPTTNQCAATSTPPLIQISAQYTDATHNIMNVQLSYQGSQFATGQVYGTSNWNGGNPVPPYGGSPYGGGSQYPYGGGSQPGYYQQPYGSYSYWYSYGTR